MEGIWEDPTERLMTGTGIEFRSISFMTRILRERGRMGRGVETAKPLGVELGKKPESPPQARAKTTAGAEAGLFCG
jgi:hypothetical protein